jgi:outer membrane lipoprotein-sorting protein
MQTVKLVSLAAAAVLTAGMLGGCATTSQVEEAKAMAQQALDKANAAQACCDANTDRVNRMYQKIMSK